MFDYLILAILGLIFTWKVNLHQNVIAFIRGNTLLVGSHLNGACNQRLMETGDTSGAVIDGLGMRKAIAVDVRRGGFLKEILPMRNPFAL